MSGAEGIVRRHVAVCVRAEERGGALQEKTKGRKAILLFSLLQLQPALEVFVGGKSDGEEARACVAERKREGEWETHSNRRGGVCLVVQLCLNADGVSSDWKGVYLRVVRSRLMFRRYFSLLLVCLMPAFLYQMGTQPSTLRKEKGRRSKGRFFK